MTYIWLLLFACADSSEKDSASEEQEETTSTDSDDKTPEVLADPITVSVRLIDAMGGSLPEGIVLTSSLESVTADSAGMGDIQVTGESQFTIQVDAPGYVTHQLVAMAGTENTSLVTFLATESLSLMVYGQLGITANPDKGTLVVALDHPDLSPATGASTDISSANDGAFVLGNMGASFSNVVPAGAGFVTFANVDPGETSISVTPAPGETCWFHAAGGDGATVNVTAQQATVAFFICDSQ